MGLLWQGGFADLWLLWPGPLASPVGLGGYKIPVPTFRPGRANDCNMLGYWGAPRAELGHF